MKDWLDGRFFLILVLAAGAAISAGLTAVLLPFLTKLKAGQAIREDGPQSHLKKAGTPTMGGIAIIASVIVTALIFGPRNSDMLVVIGTTLFYGLIGFIDDYKKVVKHDNLGLKAWQKLLLQLIVAGAVAWYVSRSSTMIAIPFIGRSVDLKGWFIPFAIFVAVAMTNGVNLTDGLDGLASTVTMIVSMAFAYIYHQSGLTEASRACAALAGACFGFLLFNSHPALIFMGDTGSLALGGCLTACALITGGELYLPVIGCIYVAEAMSVIIQVFVFQTQHGRRFFRMAPLHHHYELGGMSEKEVVRKFSMVTAIAAALVMFLYR